MPDTMPFASSFGAPVIAVPFEVIASWTAEEPALPNDGVRTDWGHVGWMKTGSGRALVLGGEMYTRFVETERGGVIVRNGSMKSTRREIDALLGAVPAETWRTLPFDLELRDGRIVIFDSAQNGAADPDQIHDANGVVVASVGTGRYRVALVEHDGCDLIRLERSGARASAKQPAVAKTGGAKKARVAKTGAKKGAVAKTRAKKTAAAKKATVAKKSAVAKTRAKKAVTKTSRRARRRSSK